MSNIVIKGEFQKVSTFYVWLPNSMQSERIFTNAQKKKLEKIEAQDDAGPGFGSYGGFMLQAKKAISDFLVEHGEEPNVAFDIVDDVFGPTNVNLALSCTLKTAEALQKSMEDVFTTLGYEITDEAKEAEIWKHIYIANHPSPSNNV